MMFIQSRSAKTIKISWIPIAQDTLSFEVSQSPNKSHYLQETGKISFSELKFSQTSDSMMPSFTDWPVSVEYIKRGLYYLFEFWNNFVWVKCKLNMGTGCLERNNIWEKNENNTIPNTKRLVERDKGLMQGLINGHATAVHAWILNFPLYFMIKL